MSAQTYKYLLSVFFLMTLCFSAAAIAAQNIKQVKIGVGVTYEPCVNELGDTVGHSNRGCIYLGSAPDLSSIFSAIGNPWQESIIRFWDRVNAEGGIGGMFDVNVRNNIQDSEYDIFKTYFIVDDLKDKVAALAMMNTPDLFFFSDLLASFDLATVYLGWNSAEEFKAYDSGAAIPTGSSYCIAAMNGVDYAATQLNNPDSVAIVSLVGDGFGQDSAVGAKIAATYHDFSVVKDLIVDPQADPLGIGAYLELITTPGYPQKPDILHVTGSPILTLSMLVSTKIGGVVDPFTGDPIPGLPPAGSFPAYQGKIVLAGAGAPNFFLLVPSAPLAGLERVIVTNPVPAWNTNTPGHQIVRDTFSDKSAVDIFNNGEFYTGGWASQYVLKETLELALKTKDLRRKAIFKASNKIKHVNSMGMHADYGTHIPVQIYGDKTTAINIFTPLSPTGYDSVAPFYKGTTASHFIYKKPCFEINRFNDIFNNSKAGYNHHKNH